MINEQAIDKQKVNETVEEMLEEEIDEVSSIKKGVSEEVSTNTVSTKDNNFS